MEYYAFIGSRISYEYGGLGVRKLSRKAAFEKPNQMGELISAENAHGFGEVQKPVSVSPGMPECPVVVDGEWLAANPEWKTLRQWQRIVLELRYPIERGSRSESTCAVMAGRNGASGRSEVQEFLDSEFASRYRERSFVLREEYDAAKRRARNDAGWLGHSVVKTLAEGAQSESVRLSAGAELIKHSDDFQQAQQHEHVVRFDNSPGRRAGMIEDMRRKCPGAAGMLEEFIEVKTAGMKA